MEPDSIGLVAILLLGVGALFWTMVRFGQLAVRAAAAVLVVVLSAVTGMAVVNDYYGYYRTWSQLSSDLSGSYASFSTRTTTRVTGKVTDGVVESVRFAGKRSGITRRGLVYLPPQYFEPRYAHTDFPVVELLHGSPGHPGNWIVELDLVKVADLLLARHESGPMIFVMPDMNVGTRFEEGVDAPGALDDTYLTQDIRTDVLARFRASRSAAEWGIAGYSSGGYAAANLSLRHRGDFGAAGIMDGYFRPQDGPAIGALHHDKAAEAANDPLRTAATLPAGTAPLPSYWLSVGTGDPADAAAAGAFVHALHGLEQVTLYKEAGAGHNFYAWSGSLPRMLTWMWTQLAAPELRVQFPVAGAVRGGSLVAPPIPWIVTHLHQYEQLHHLPRAHKTATRSLLAGAGHTAVTGVRAGQRAR